jgi:hypothetical protein
VVDEVLIVEAKVSNDDFSGGLRIVADKLMTLGEARGRYARALQLRLNGEVGASGGRDRGRRSCRACSTPFREGVPDSRALPQCRGRGRAALRRRLARAPRRQRCWRACANGCRPRRSRVIYP